MYTSYGLSLSDSQKQSLAEVGPLTLRLSINQLDGEDKLALTAMQIKHIKKNKSMGKGADITLSKTQLQKMKKKGGFIPLIFAGLAALGALAGGAASIAKTVHEKQTADATLVEQERHNRQTETGSGLKCCPKCSGSGLYLSKNR
jgi:hypothetical protein